MLLTVRNIRHIAAGEQESIAREIIYFEIPPEKNEKPEKAHCCCCKRNNTHTAKKRNMVKFT
jgi:hypothetical protein